MNPALVAPYCSVFAQGRVAGPPKFIKQSVALDVELSSPLDPYHNKWVITVWVKTPKFKKYEPMENDIIAIRGDLVVKYLNENIYLNLYGATIDSIIKTRDHQIKEAPPDETKKNDAEQPRQEPEPEPKPEPQAKPPENKETEPKPEVKQEVKTEQKPPAQAAQPKPQEKTPANPPVKTTPPKMPEVYSFAAVEKYNKELEEYKKSQKGDSK